METGRLKCTPSAGRLMVLKAASGHSHKPKCQPALGAVYRPSQEEMAPKQPQDSGKRSKFNKVHYYQESISDQGGDHLEDKNYT